MDDYTESGIVGRGATKATAELGEKLFSMVVEEIVPMVMDALKEENPKRYRRSRQ
jgi:creatinine amidohydrolase/Fe(II)-dependent formamide hydrolase-like protein